jgi:hypothetical protein
MRFHDSNLPHAQNQDCRARATPLRPRQTPIPTISCTTNSCHASQMPSKPRPVEFYPLIILSVVASEASRVRATFGICRYPSPLGSIGIIDLARNSSQIRHNKELRGQNPGEQRTYVGCVLRCLCPLRLDHDGLVENRSQGQMSQRGCGKNWLQFATGTRGAEKIKHRLADKQLP